jgi:hypothetical protein
MRLVRSVAYIGEVGGLRRGWESNIKWIIQKHDGKVWIALIWLEIETSAGLL